MGTDIHGVFQRYDEETKTWSDIPSLYEQNRHYQLFAVLADVRNGCGFAGVRTGDPVEPIAFPRGLPDDFEIVDGEFHPLKSVEYMPPWRQKYLKEDGGLSQWMGDHSHSYLTGEEILAWADGNLYVTKIGVLSREEYEKWDGVTKPSNYCGWTSGPEIVVIRDSEDEKESTPGWTHIQCEWKASVHDELKYFIDEIRRLVDEYGKIRFVFGFDN